MRIRPEITENSLKAYIKEMKNRLKSQYIVPSYQSVLSSCLLLSTYSCMSRSSLLVVIKYCRVLYSFNFIIVSAGFLFPVIQRISVISLYLYNYLILRILIIKYFSVIISRLTKYLKREYKSVQIASKISWAEPEVI